MNQKVVLYNLNPQVLEKLQILANQNNRTLSDEIKAILAVVTIAEVSKTTYTSRHYPLRGKPITIAADFDESMPELWEALAE